MIRRRHESAGEVVPNLAPMVDVIMVLLVFFLLAATLNLAERGILQTELDPRSGPGEGQAVAIQSLMLRVALGDIDEGADASITVLEQTLPDGDFGALLGYLVRQREAGFDPANPVVIGAETNVRWKYVIRAMDAAVRAGFKNIQFAVSFRADSTTGAP
jgi:biopolymer transport protein ExbD